MRSIFVCLSFATLMAFGQEKPQPTQPTQPKIEVKKAEMEAEAAVKKMKGVAIRDVSHLNKGQPIVTVQFYSMDVAEVEFSKLVELTKLYRLTFIQCKNTDKALKQAEVLKGITSISLENSDVTDAGIESVVKHSKLQMLDLSGVNRVTKAGWKALAASSLEILVLTSSTISDDGLNELAGLANLTELRLDKTSLTLNGCGPAFASWKKLKELNVSESPVGDTGLASIGQAKTLIKLNLSGCPFTDAGMKPLGKLVRLKELDMSDCPKITGKGFDELSDLYVLEYLILAGSGVNDSGIKPVSEMRNVQKLDLDRTKLTADGLSKFATNRGLVELSIQETKANNSVVIDIAVAAKKLKKISVRKTQATKEVIAELKKKNIDVFIDFD